MLKISWGIRFLEFLCIGVCRSFSCYASLKRIKIIIAIKSDSLFKVKAVVKEAPAKSNFMLKLVGKRLL